MTVSRTHRGDTHETARFRPEERSAVRPPSLGTHAKGAPILRRGARGPRPPDDLLHPADCVEQANDGGGDRLGTVAWGMPLYTIYWGSYWASSDGQALQSQIQNSLNPMLYFSHYLDGLQQYGVPHHAGVPGSGTVEVNNFSDPADGFSQSNLHRRHQQRDRQPGAARYRRLLQRGALPGLHPPRHHV